MGVFAGCQDARNMTHVQEIDCPRCGKKDGIEIFERDGSTIGESSCEFCGYVIPEGMHWAGRQNTIKV